MNRMRTITSLVLIVLVLLVMLLGAACGNNTPTISSLTADPETVAPGHTCTITCTATDPDGDTLTYS